MGGRVVAVHRFEVSHNDYLSSFKNGFLFCISRVLAQQKQFIILLTKRQPSRGRNFCRGAQKVPPVAAAAAAPARAKNKTCAFGQNSL
jgi:hypothetical protein